MELAMHQGAAVVHLALLGVWASRGKYNTAHLNTSTQQDCPQEAEHMSMPST